ncbi:hypothetical protein K438DRAFT_1159137 [Mycena galopus ATCC 62051]|nr:hypothetical protein K438DRAFT_1159137 [Mycena galopus ATCC 62051]
MTRTTTSTRCSCSPSPTSLSSRPRVRPASAAYIALTAQLPGLHVLGTVHSTTFPTVRAALLTTARILSAVPPSDTRTSCMQHEGNGSTRPRRCVAVCADGVDPRCDDTPAKSARAHGDDAQPPLQQRLRGAQESRSHCAPPERTAALAAFRERRPTASARGERGEGSLAAGLLVEWRPTMGEVAADLLRLEDEQVDVFPTTNHAWDANVLSEVDLEALLDRSPEMFSDRGTGWRSEADGKGQAAFAVFEPPPDAGSKALARMICEE